MVSPIALNKRIAQKLGHNGQIGLLPAIIFGHYFINMRNVLENVPDSYTITIEHKVRFQGGICPKKFQFD